MFQLGRIHILNNHFIQITSIMLNNEAGLLSCSPSQRGQGDSFLSPPCYHVRWSDDMPLNENNNTMTKSTLFKFRLVFMEAGRICIHTLLFLPPGGGRETHLPPDTQFRRIAALKLWFWFNNSQYSFKPKISVNINCFYSILFCLQRIVCSL